MPANTPTHPQVDEGPERVLVLGWGPKCLMADLIKELDHGLSPLPAGSEVVFANTHNPDDTLGAVLQNTTLDYIKVRHGAARKAFCTAAWCCC